MKTILIFSLFLAYPLVSMGNEVGSALTFAQWKNQQVIEAENRTARLENKIILNKRSGLEKPEDQVKNEEALQAAVANLQVIRELNLEEYVHVYLLKFSNNINELERVARELTESEIMELLKLLFRSKSNNAVLETSRPLPRNAEFGSDFSAQPAT